MDSTLCTEQTTLRGFLAVVENYADRSKVVLLDPDTGIEPGRATAKHATTTEVSIIWQALRSGDWLVVYQHAARGGSWTPDVPSLLMPAA